MSDDLREALYWPFYSFSRETHEVLVDGRVREDFGLFFERGGEARTLIYFEALTPQERENIQIREKPVIPLSLRQKRAE